MAYGRMNFALALHDARESVTQTKHHLTLPSYKVKELLQTDKWALKRELQEAEDWVAWLETNMPKTERVAAEGLTLQDSGFGHAPEHLLDP